MSRLTMNLDAIITELRQAGSVGIREIDPRRPTAILDGDDTLWESQERYDRVKEDFRSLMDNQEMGFPGLVEHLDQIDARRAESSLGLSRERFLESLLITYGYCCGRFEESWDMDIENQIRQSWLDLSEPPQLYSYTQKFLSSIRNTFNTILVTSGDRENQIDKLESHGKEFLDHFCAVHVVPKKDPSILREILESADLEPKRTWMVGNSLRSDINPAMEVGIHAIHLSRKTWEFEQEDPRDSSFSVAQNLEDAETLLLEGGKGGDSRNS